MELWPCRFFIVKSSNRENLNLSLERGLWATHRNNEAKLNDAYDSCENVILIFSVNETRHFQVFLSFKVWSRSGGRSLEFEPVVTGFKVKWSLSRVSCRTLASVIASFCDLVISWS